MEDSLMPAAMARARLEACTTSIRLSKLGPGGETTVYEAQGYILSCAGNGQLDTWF